MVNIVYFEPWTPFSTVEGNRGVYKLICDYDPAVVKEIRHTIQSLKIQGFPPYGGWLPDRGAWFIKLAALPQLKLNLALIGVELKPKGGGSLSSFLSTTKF